MKENSDHPISWRDQLMRDVINRWVLGRWSLEKIDPQILLVSLGVGFNFRSHLRQRRRRGKLVLGRLGRVPVATVRVPPGTLQLESVLAVAAETSIRYCLGIGMLSASDPGLSIGDVVCPIEAQGNDGLTACYPGPDRAAPDPHLLELARTQSQAAGVKLHEGRVFTTASLCLEKAPLGTTAHGEFMGTDVQTAPFYKVARHYGLAALALGVVSDSSCRREIYLTDRKLKRDYLHGQEAAFAVLEAVVKRLHLIGE